MRQQTRPLKEPAEKVVQDIRRATRKHYSAEEKIRIVLEGLVARTALPSCVPARGSRRTCTIAGTSWRLERSAWLAIRLGLPPRTRSTICVARLRLSVGNSAATSGTSSHFGRMRSQSQFQATSRRDAHGSRSLRLRGSKCSSDQASRTVRMSGSFRARKTKTLIPAMIFGQGHSPRASVQSLGSRLAVVS
jgi:hypothetical protein